MKRFAFAAALVLAAAAPVRAQAADPPIVGEARAFMERYAADLAAGNREAIADRYDRRGAWLVGSGRKRLMPFDSLRAAYLGPWRKPDAFEWQDLSYEPAGPDAVVVTGRFRWTAGSEVLAFTYTGLLLRRDGVLRIRLEDEDMAPPPRR